MSEREFVSIEVALKILSDVIEVENLSADSVVLDVDMDSLDLIEFLYQIDVDFESALNDETLFEGWGDGLTLGEMYGRIRDVSARLGRANV